MLPLQQVSRRVIRPETLGHAGCAFSPQFPRQRLPKRTVILRDMLPHRQQHSRLWRIETRPNLHLFGRHRKIETSSALLTNRVVPQEGRDMGLIRCLVLRKTRVPVDPVNTLLRLPHISRREQQHFPMHRAHQFQHGLLYLFLVNSLARRKPLPIIICLQIRQERHACGREAPEFYAGCHIPIIRPMVHAATEYLSAVPQVVLRTDEPLAPYTRFGIGGPADIYLETPSPEAFTAALRIAQERGLETVVIGGGTNLVVADEGFRGVILKLTNRQMRVEGGDAASIYVESGATLQTLVDFAVDKGLRGLETMTGIPGWTGAAIYGNAGAYGHSIEERVREVSFFDGTGLRSFNNAQCEFRYRESIFKRHKEWIIFSARLAMERGDAAELRAAADKILAVRNRKYPPTMKCAGSIFKNYLLAELPAAVAAEVPPNVIIEGKVPSAWFLEQVGAKGMRKGDIHVADYHANLIYNAGHGTARELTGIIHELKQRVEQRWGMPLEEEVQYIGFPSPAHA